MPVERPKNRLGPPTTPSDPGSEGGPSRPARGPNVAAPVATAAPVVAADPVATAAPVVAADPVLTADPVATAAPVAPVHPPSIHNRRAMASPPPDSFDPPLESALNGPDEPPAPAGDAFAADQARSVDTLTPTTEQPPGPSRAGRDLPVAIAVGVGLGIAVVLSLVIYRPAFLGIVLAAVLISVWEIGRALNSVRVRPPLLPLMLGASAMIVVTWLSGPGGLAVTTMLTVLAAIVWRLSDGPVGYFRDASTAALITVYVPLLACFAVLLLRPDDGVTRIVVFILTVVCSDVGGYAAGVLFGKHPMSPTVSPKKSWEGLGGSVLACMIAGLLLVGIALDGAWWHGIVYGAAIAVTATIGDLGESIIKRDLGIKDMGNLLPGHGGLMDRMDSLLPSAAVAYLLLTAFVPPVLT